MNSAPLHHPLYREALDHFRVSASQTAQHLNPALHRWLWPDNKQVPVSLATLCEVVLVAAFAAKTGRELDLKAFLAAKGIVPKADTPVPALTV
jgi:hypothetical protein